MSFFTREDSTGEILKRLLCTHCERKIGEEIQTGIYSHDMCVEVTDNPSYWAVKKYARKACLLYRFALAILQDDGTPLSGTSEGMPPERANKYSFKYAEFLMPHSGTYTAHHFTVSSPLHRKTIFIDADTRTPS